MLTTVRWVDMTEYLKTRSLPSLAFERSQGPEPSPGASAISASQKPRVGEYWVLNGGALGGELSWSVVTDGDYVRVPLIAYRTEHRAVASLFGLGVEVGAKALADLAKKSTRKKPVHMLLVLGDQCPDLGDAFNAFVGLAFLVDEG